MKTRSAPAAVGVHGPTILDSAGASFGASDRGDGRHATSNLFRCEQVFHAYSECLHLVVSYSFPSRPLVHPMDVLLHDG